MENDVQWNLKACSPAKHSHLFSNVWGKWMRLASSCALSPPTPFPRSLPLLLPLPSSTLLVFFWLFLCSTDRLSRANRQELALIPVYLRKPCESFCIESLTHSCVPPHTDRDILFYLTGGGRALPPHVNKATVLYFRDVLDLVQEMMVKVC